MQHSKPLFKGAAIKGEFGRKSFRRVANRKLLKDDAYVASFPIRLWSLLSRTQKGYASHARQMRP